MKVGEKVTEELKRRIEMIKRGEVPLGYKKTQAGVVPIEWEEKTLKNLLDFKNGINANKEKFGTGTKLISVLDILDDSPIIYESIRNSINIDKEMLENYSVTYGDILFQRSSENFDDAGKSNVYLDKQNIATYSGFVIRGKKIAEYEPFYLNVLLKTKNVRKQVVRLSAGSQHINIGQESLSKIIINIADISEQKKIVKILMKWDEAVDLQHRIIQKLEKQKKALLHKLLTPKEGWGEAILCSISEMYSGGTPSTFEELYWNNGNIKWIQSGLIQNNTIRKSDITQYITENGLKNSAAKLIKENSVLIAITGATCGNIAFLPFKATANQSVVSLTPYVDNSKFIYYSLIKNRKKILDLQGGSAQGGTTLSDLKKIHIWLPKLSEQNNIANILSKMDENIDLHEQKLIKLKEQRKAIMQLLLTGIVRVNNE